MTGLVFLLAGQALAAAPYGVLLLAHGGEPRWNQEVEAIRQAVDRKVPTEVAFGMADPAAIQGAIGRLETRRAAKIVAVPLFVNSASEVMDQTRYALGLSEKPSEVLRDALAQNPHAAHHHHAFSLERAKTRLPLVLTPALDAHPLVAGVLLERAKALSRDPKRETVILVGHGPVDDGANSRWLATMRKLAALIRRNGGFRAVVAATIRDDSPEMEKTKAAEELRGMVRAASRNGGRALVVPYLIARGGVEEHIVAILSGLDYAWDGKTVCPHPDVARWVAETAAEGDAARITPAVKSSPSSALP